MAFMYKTILRSENHVFDWTQNRFNSKKSSVIAFPKGGEGPQVWVCEMDNKTGKVDFKETTFKKSTLDRIQKIITA